MELENVILEKKDQLAIITINHPPANAWNLATAKDFEVIINDVIDDKGVRVVIITGSGDKCFSAGFDVKDGENAPITSDLGRKLWRRIDRMIKPTIAAMNGSALGGGLELAMSCHFRIMAEAPKYMVGLTELNLGLLPGWGGTQRLPRLVGRAKALDMILFSRRIGAAEALQIGLVDRISTPEKLMDDAIAFATELTERPPLALQWVLKSMATGMYEGLDAGLDVEAEGSAAMRGTKDREEGFKAFLEKRKPVWRGE